MLTASSLLNVASGGNLTLENITIDGQGDVKAGVVVIGKGKGSGDGAGKDINVTFSTPGGGNVEATAALVTVASGGNLTLKTGATLQNNKNTSGEGGGIYNAGTVTINGGTITGNSAKNGGGIFVANGGTVNLGAGGTINISRNISRYSSIINRNNEMIQESGISGADTTEKISNGYIPFFANNIVYTNTSGSPIKVIGDIKVANGTKIGLSPNNLAANAVLIDGSGGTIVADNFSFGTVSGSNLSVGTNGTGTTGPGGGTVFFCNEARYEISDSLGDMTWVPAAGAIATYNSDSSVNGGKNDWFFPMIDVLGVADRYLSSIQDISCWFSSEFSNVNDAWRQDFKDGVQASNNKGNTASVRVVRGFNY